MSVTEVSAADLKRMQSEGAEVEVHHKRILVPEVVAQLHALTETVGDNEPLAEAVLMITDAIEKIELRAEPVNMRPVAEAISVLRDTVVLLRKSIEESKPGAHEPCGYQVNITRDNRRDMESFTLTPIKEAAK